MVVTVVSRLRQATSRALSASNVVGDGMLVRLRSTTLGILGLVAAVGLGLVGVLSQQGWPDVATGPPPQAPQLVQNDPIALPESVAQAPVPSSHGGGSGSASAKVVTEPSPSGSPDDEAVAAPVAAGGQPQSTSPSGQGQPQPQVQPPESTTGVRQVPTDRTPVEDSPSSAGKGTAESSPGRSGESNGHSKDAHEHAGKSHGRPYERPDDTDGSSEDSVDRSSRGGSPGLESEAGESDSAGY
ncbi:MAG: hypothetical protein ACHQCI_05740, partial [Solirubrobacterales bacterium]